MHSRKPSELQWSNGRVMGYLPSQAWLVSTGRFKGIDSLRHHSRSDVSLDGLDDLAERLVIQTSDNLEAGQ